MDSGLLYYVRFAFALLFIIGFFCFCFYLMGKFGALVRKFFSRLLNKG